MPKTKRSSDSPLNELQLEAARVYCGGEFAHITDRSEFDGGDTLFTLVLNELEEATVSEAARRMRTAIESLQELASLFEQQELNSPANAE